MCGGGGGGVTYLLHSVLNLQYERFHQTIPEHGPRRLLSPPFQLDAQLRRWRANSVLPDNPPFQGYDQMSPQWSFDQRREWSTNGCFKLTTWMCGHYLEIRPVMSSIQLQFIIRETQITRHKPFTGAANSLFFFQSLGLDLNLGGIIYVTIMATHHKQCSGFCIFPPLLVRTNQSWAWEG